MYNGQNRKNDFKFNLNILFNNKFFVIFFAPFLLGALTTLGFSPYNFTFINFFSFSILLTSSLDMKKLNKKFRNQNKSTDVLSFPFLSSSNLKFTKQKKFYIGDVATSYEIISSRSKKNNFFLEFDKAWIHGLLHLIGYNHINNKDYFKMNKIEKRILNSIH